MATMVGCSVTPRGGLPVDQVARGDSKGWAAGGQVLRAAIGQEFGFATTGTSQPVPAIQPQAEPEQVTVPY
jgi:hypothetical protein